jgi:chromosome segregation ATPase
VSALRKRVEALVAREAELEGLLSEREDALAAASASVDKLTAEKRELSATLAKMKEEERRKKEEEGLLRQKLELAENKVKVSFQGHVSFSSDLFLRFTSL